MTISLLLWTYYPWTIHPFSKLNLFWGFRVVGAYPRYRWGRGHRCVAGLTLSEGEWIEQKFFWKPSPLLRRHCQWSVQLSLFFLIKPNSKRLCWYIFPVKVHLIAHRVKQLYLQWDQWCRNTKTRRFKKKNKAWLQDRGGSCSHSVPLIAN